ncbi:hypothetical protein LDENG_00119310 [Lucifuga dentata]|nr:hypothetical protein LDENG_00119310 [Lucifuga dentata]
MGCSPSRGKLFEKAGGNALLAAATQDGAEPRPEQDQDQDQRVNHSHEEHRHSEEDASTEAGRRQTAADAEADVKPQEAGEDVQTEDRKKLQRRKKSPGVGQRGQGDKSSIVHSHVNLPLHMLRAQQAAYEFLNPNISRCETLLGLLDQAAHTHLALQPRVHTLLQYFEELNQALEEMAEEGELMLKQHMLSGMMGLPVMPAKPDTINASDPPLDLLQQMLQHSTEKMRLVGHSVQTLGDTTLDEAVQSFMSLSKLLAEKLQAKQAAEKRLAQVLAQVEEAVVKKSKPEDSALHSEDSGIGGENESLTGSERHRHQRGSAGSGSCGSGTNICAALANNLPKQTGLNKGEEEEEDNEDDDDEHNIDHCDRPERRRRSNSSPPDPSQPLPYMGGKSLQEQPTVRRPLSAASAIKHEQAASTCLNPVLELRKNQRELDQRMKSMAESWGNSESHCPHYGLYSAGQRRHSLGCAQKDSLNTNQSPCLLPRLEPKAPGRHSVRRLINNFSQGVDGRPGQSLANIPPHIRRPRKTLLAADAGNGGEGSLVLNGNNNNNIWPDSRNDLDVDSLPPPPPEVLLDNSFQSTKDTAREEEASLPGLAHRPPMINQRTAVPHRLRKSLQNVEVLPNRANPKPGGIRTMPPCPIRQDAVMGTQLEQQSEQHLELDLYQQACKIIHLCNATESCLMRNAAQQGGRGPSTCQIAIVPGFESNAVYEAEGPPCSFPVTGPPVSRVRLPPSCPVRHRLQSPPIFRPQPPSRPPSHQGSPRAGGHSIEEIIPSVSFHDARSVFCQKPQTWTTTCSSVLPRPWGEASRGRKSTRGTDTSTRCTEAEQRPDLTCHAEVSSSTQQSDAHAVKER